MYNLWIAIIIDISV